MLQADVVPSEEFLRECERLSLSPFEIPKILAELSLQPMKDGCVYPAMSVRYRHHKAGLYQRVFEVRNVHGYPLLVRTLALFVSYVHPLFLLSISDKEIVHGVTLTVTDMVRLETLTREVATTYEED